MIRTLVPAAHQWAETLFDRRLEEDDVFRLVVLRPDLPLFPAFLLRNSNRAISTAP